MSIEIERKFLVKSSSYRGLATGQSTIKQGYLSKRRESTVRIRIKDNNAYMTVKGATVGATRNEWEYIIPVDDAREMLQLCEGKVISKTRYYVPYEGYLWEVDEFTEPRQFTVAEVELPSESAKIALPPFIGEEVTGDPAYYNSNL